MKFCWNLWSYETMIKFVIDQVKTASKYILFNCKITQVKKCFNLMRDKALSTFAWFSLLELIAFFTCSWYGKFKSPQTYSFCTQEKTLVRVYIVSLHFCSLKNTVVQKGTPSRWGDFKNLKTLLYTSDSKHVSFFYQVIVHLFTTEQQSEKKFYLFCSLGKKIHPHR